MLAKAYLIGRCQVERLLPGRHLLVSFQFAEQGVSTGFAPHVVCWWHCQAARAGKTGQKRSVAFSQGDLSLARFTRTI